MRGVKLEERTHRQENLIAKVTITDDNKEQEPPGNLHMMLIESLLMNRTLLWVYSSTPDVTTIMFGYDRPVENGKKIGHAALIEQATIAGEIRKIGGGGFGSGWCISNESGAWGAMDRENGKSDMLRNVAHTMTARLGIIVSAEAAYSRYGPKRMLQQLVRGKTRKLQ